MPKPTAQDVASHRTRVYLIAMLALSFIKPIAANEVVGQNPTVEVRMSFDCSYEFDDIETPGPITSADDRITLVEEVGNSCHFKVKCKQGVIRPSGAPKSCQSDFKKSCSNAEADHTHFLTSGGSCTTAKLDVNRLNFDCNTGLRKRVSQYYEYCGIPPQSDPKEGLCFAKSTEIRAGTGCFDPIVGVGIENALLASYPNPDRTRATFQCKLVVPNCELLKMSDLRDEYVDKATGDRSACYPADGFDLNEGLCGTEKVKNKVNAILRGKKLFKIEYSKKWDRYIPKGNIGFDEAFRKAKADCSAHIGALLRRNPQAGKDFCRRKVKEILRNLDRDPKYNRAYYCCQYGEDDTLKIPKLGPDPVRPSLNSGPSQSPNGLVPDTKEELPDIDIP